MAYFGKPSGQGQGKFFKGSSADSPDLHWRLRVERELLELERAEEEGEEGASRAAPPSSRASTRTGRQANGAKRQLPRSEEEVLLRKAVRKHGGNWSRIFADDSFAALRKYEARDLAARWQVLLRRDTAREAEEVERAEYGLPQPPRRAVASRPARQSPTPSRTARRGNGGSSSLAAPLKSPVRHSGGGSTSPLQQAGGSTLRGSGRAAEQVERERRAREAAEARARKEAAARRTLEKRLGSMESMLSTYVQAKSGGASHRARQTTPGPHSPGRAKFGV